MACIYGIDSVEFEETMTVPQEIDVALLNAVIKLESFEVIKFLVEQGANVSYMNHAYETALDVAVWSRNMNLVKYFLSLGVTQKILNVGLLGAATVGDFDMVQLIAEHGARIEFDSSHGYDSIRHIEQENNLYILDYLINIGRFDVNKTNKKNISALLYAAMNDDVKVVKYLVYNGAEVNCITNKQNTPLMHAVKNDNKEMVIFLLGNGANVHVKTKGNRTALNYAAIYASAKIVDILITAGSDMNNVDSFGMTPILNAFLRNNLKVVEYLRGKGGDIFQRFHNGKSAFHLAARFGNDVTVDYLLVLGLDINVMDENGLIPLHSAAFNGRVDMMKYLIDLGADFTKRTPNENTLLEFARHKKWRSMINYFNSII